MRAPKFSNSPLKDSEPPASLLWMDDPPSNKEIMIYIFDGKKSFRNSSESREKEMEREMDMRNKE